MAALRKKAGTLCTLFYFIFCLQFQEAKPIQMPRRMSPCRVLNHPVKWHCAFRLTPHLSPINIMVTGWREGRGRRWNSSPSVERLIMGKRKNVQGKERKSRGWNADYLEKMQGETSVEQVMGSRLYSSDTALWGPVAWTRDTRKVPPLLVIKPNQTKWKILQSNLNNGSKQAKVGRGACREARAEFREFVLQHEGLPSPDAFN